MRQIPISFATNIVHTALLKWFNNSYLLLAYFNTLLLSTSQRVPYTTHKSGLYKGCPMPIDYY